MKKILLITRNFPPLNGGMEKLNHHTYLELSKDFNLLISAPIGSKDYLKLNTLHCQFPHKPLLLFLWLSFWKSLKFCLKEKPDLIIAGSGATALAARIIAYIGKVKVITFVHGLDIVASNQLYQMLFLPAIRNCDAVWVNSRNTAQLAINKGIFSKKIRIIYPGVTLPQTNLKLFNPDQFKAELGLDRDCIILLSVGRLTERKGVVEFIKYSLINIVKANPRVVFVIIGGEPDNALQHKVGEKERIIQTIQEMGIENHVVLLGHVSNFQLEQAFLSSQLHIFPGIDLPGDVEGFGMVAIESSAYGLPTVAFAVGGIPEAVSHDISGWLIKPNDYSAMTKTILNNISGFKSVDAKVNIESCQKHAAQFSWCVFGEKIRQLSREIINYNG